MSFGLKSKFYNKENARYLVQTDEKSGWDNPLPHITVQNHIAEAHTEVSVSTRNLSEK
jgi:hypothetical protein